MNTSLEGHLAPTSFLTFNARRNRVFSPKLGFLIAQLANNDQPTRQRSRRSGMTVETKHAPSPRYRGLHFGSPQLKTRYQTLMIPLAQTKPREPSLLSHSFRHIALKNSGCREKLLKHHVSETLPVGWRNTIPRMTDGYIG